MLFDSHAHIDDKRFKGEIDKVLQRALAAGVTGILNVGADMASSSAGAKLKNKYDMVYASVGVHPHYAKDVRKQDYDQLAKWAKEEKIVAVGEIGLDYYRNLSPKDVQKNVFIEHIDLAKNLHKPIIIHDRDAHADVLAIVKKEAKGLTGVFHCFSGSVEMAKEVLKLGFYISIAGSVTFDNSVKLKEVAAYTPLERLFIETDCPYLTPQPHRGARNEPAYVRLVGEEVARIRGISLEELGEATTSNVKTLFQI